MNMAQEKQSDWAVLDFPPPPIRFQGRHFAFAHSGLHTSFADQVTHHGGIVDDALMDTTDYLVIDTKANDSNIIYRATEMRSSLDSDLKLVSVIAFTSWLRATIRGRVSESMLDELEAVYLRWQVDSLELAIPESWDWSRGEDQE